MNSIILAAGTSSRFIPLSFEYPKGLLEVRGEILLERQIRQLLEAGIYDITVVTGYKARKFEYLREKYGVDTVYNEDYDRYNNTSSIIRVIDRLSNTFICCSDHFFKINVFLEPANNSYYAARYAHGQTNEYCLAVNREDDIIEVQIGGQDTWYMAGHAFFTESFSKKFREIMTKAYAEEPVRKGYWEDVYISHIQDLSMKIRRYSDDDIIEFDTLDELRMFDKSYVNNTRSLYVKEICNKLSCKERDLHNFQKIQHDDNHIVFSFYFLTERYKYDDQNPLKISKY